MEIRGGCSYAHWGNYSRLGKILVPMDESDVV